MLATAAVGAIWSSCSPDFGVKSVLDRFRQIQPKVLFAIDGYRYGGKDFDCRPALRDIVAGLPELQKVVYLPYLNPADRTYFPAYRIIALTIREDVVNKVNRVWVMNRYADGPMSDDNLVIKEFPLQEPGPGQIRVRAVYLSLDPSNRVWLAPYFTYLPPIPMGDPMRGFIIGIVDRSCAEGWEVGDIAYGLMQWADYSIIDPLRVAFMMKMPATDGISIEAWISALAMNGHTAYYGMLLKGRPLPGETVLISGAAGATGVLAGQIAKTAGARVVGIAGGPEKCLALREEYGFDDAIDYKQGDLVAAIARTCPDGVDVFFDNIGGEILDAALVNLAMNARVVICGGNSEYDNMSNPEAQYGLKNHFMLLMRRATMEGFVVFDFLGGAVQEKAQRSLAQWYREGRLRYRAHVVDGIEAAFPSLRLLFNGGNKGKLLVRIGKDSEPDKG